MVGSLGVMLWWFSLLGCDANDPSDSDARPSYVDSDLTDTDLELTFETVRPLLVTTCATSGCHGGTQQPDLSDPTADSLVGVTAQQVRMPYVDPGYLDTSYLIYKLRGTQLAAGGTGQQMPLSGTLSEEDVALVEAWVLAGAQD